MGLIKDQRNIVELSSLWEDISISGVTCIFELTIAKHNGVWIQRQCQCLRSGLRPTNSDGCSTQCRKAKAYIPSTPC